MRLPRNELRLAFFLLALAVWTARAEDAPDAYVVQGEPNEPGYTVTVEFSVDPAGSVTDARVVKSEARALNSVTLATVLAGRVNPRPLPAPGSGPQPVTRQIFYPVPAYDSGKPLPAGVELPRPVFQPSPAYPFEYRRSKMTGGVWLSVTVGPEGTVTACKIIRASHPQFGPVAEQAVRLWKFKPATLNGRPVETTFNVPVSFQIAGEDFSWLWLVAPAPSADTFAVITETH
jgi:TonB family protein